MREGRAVLVAENLRTKVAMLLKRTEDFIAERHLGRSATLWRALLTVPEGTPNDEPADFQVHVLPPKRQEFANAKSRAECD